MRQFLKQLVLLTMMLTPAIRKYMDEPGKKEEPADVMMTSKQACEFLCITPRTLRRRKEAGLIRCDNHVGRSPLYTKKELERYLKENK